MRLVIILALSVSVTAVHGGSQVESYFRLSVDKYKKGHRVYWWSRSLDKSSWPENCKGFWVMRKKVGDESWNRLNSSLIRPCVLEDLDLSLCIPEPEERKRLEAKIAMLVDMSEKLKGQKKEYGKHVWMPDQFLLPQGNDLIENSLKLNSSPAELAAAVLIDPDFAFISGFGYYDTTCEAGIDYVYGISPSTAEEGDEPGITFNPNAENKGEFVVKDFSGKLYSSNKVGVKWEIPIADNAIVGFKVYRKEPHENTFTFVEDEYGRLKSGKLQFSANDSTYTNKELPSGLQTIEYKYVPIHKLGVPLKKTSYYEFHLKKK